MEIIIAGSPRKGMYSDRMAEAYASITGGEIIYARSVNVHPCHVSWKGRRQMRAEG